MDSSTVVLALRVVLSLAVVLGLLWWLGRRTAGTRGRVRQASVTVVGRQSLSRHSSVAVVEVEGRRLLLGVTDQGVSLLTELEQAAPAAAAARTEIDPAELADHVGLEPDTSDIHPTPAARTPAVPTPRNPLEGSILDVTAWRQAVVAVQERTIRR